MTRLQASWYGLMVARGLGFGLIGERRPFGQDAHPLVVYFAVAAAGLLVLRTGPTGAHPGFWVPLGCGHVSGRQLYQHLRDRRAHNNDVPATSESRRYHKTNL